MRNLTNHIVQGDSSNHQLAITVIDEPGAGGACHRYDITGFDTSRNASAMDAKGYADHFGRAVVLFQNGPISERGVNGVTQEALLAIVIDRLRSFQAGPFACDDNARALEDCESALFHLQQRTRKRIARGVEGKTQK
jgi:hypothetical protein